MFFKDITILNDNFEIEEHMNVETVGEKITYVGKEAIESKEEVFDGKNALLMPGFVNAHAHSPMTLLRGYGENMVLQDWLFKKIFPFEDHLTNEAVYNGTMLAYAESLRFGIVSTSDMYYFLDDMLAAVKDSGVKANVCRSVSSFETENLDQVLKEKEVARVYEQYHNTLDGRAKIDLSIHSEYTNSEEVVRALTEYGKTIGARMQVHVSETKAEHEECKQRHNGMTPVEYFEHCGLLDLPTTAAHCVWVEGDDFDILKAKNVTVASNPVSNAKLASGVCNVPELLKRGINVAIGTDSVASNNSLNFVEEIKAFAVASKVKQLNPTVVSPKEALYAATRAGALSQGREDCGLLKEGFRADLIVMDLSVPYMHPIHDLKNNLVYSASGADVRMTMVDGKVLYKDGEYKTIDVEKAIYGTEKATKEIIATL